MDTHLRDAPVVIYMIRCLDRYKIGRSSNPKRRIANVIRQQAYEAECWAVGEFRDASETEAQLHRELKAAGLQRKGEWFELAPADAEKVAAWINRGDGNPPVRDLDALRKRLKIVEQLIDGRPA